MDRWDEALPLGNGLLGALVWGTGRQLNVSLDRGDLWDLRPTATAQRPDWTYATLQRLVAERRQDEIARLFDDPYDEAAPTKIRAGRLELTFDEEKSRFFALDIRQAEARVDLSSATVHAFVSASAPVLMLHVRGATPALSLKPASALNKLGYPPPQYGRQGPLAWLVQEGALGLRYAIVAGSRSIGSDTTIAVAVARAEDGRDPVAIGRRQVTAAMARGYEAMRRPHVAWWQTFWTASDVSVPDGAVQAHYNLVKYFHGAASRRGAPPMPLQGVWTADEDRLPPWKGDFHNDLNTQMTYLPYHAAGLIESGASFLDFNWRLLPAYRQFAKRFYGLASGAVVPGVMALDGLPLAGWAQYSLSPTMGAWVAHSFYLHWRYTGDPLFLTSRALPFTTAIGDGLRQLLRENDRGRLVLPLSSSPEVFDNSLRAWLTPNSNFDLALLRWLFGALEEMHRAAGDPAAAAAWRAALARLDPLDADPAGGALTLARGLPLHESHRHFSHTLAFHPLNLLDPERHADERTMVLASLDQLERLGTREWVGYSFSWMAAMLARAGRGDAALGYLQTFLRAFVLRNGFHVNGDQTKSGLSRFTYRPFTLEGNFLAMHAVHEMLLRSTGELATADSSADRQAGDPRWLVTLRIFPATPSSWRDVSMRDLRAEGGLRISAERRGGHTTRVRISATRQATVRIHDPFDGAPVTWSRPGIRANGATYELKLRPGDMITGQRRDRHSQSPTPSRPRLSSRPAS